MRVDKQRAEFCDKLRGICSKSKKSREKIAEEVGIRPETLWTYTSGKSSPTTKTLKKILEVCGAEWSEVEP